MDFEKKLKSRLIISISYISIGVLFIILYSAGVIKNEYIMSFSVALTIMGVLKVLQYKQITKNKETIQKRRIMETDDRNISIIHKAKSAAFGWYVLIGCAMVIIFEVIGKRELSNIIALNVCALIILYWINYFVYRKKF